MIRKWIRGLTLAFLMMALIISCQRTTPDLGNSPVTLKLSGWGSSPTEQRLLQQVIRQFEVSHPRIRVKLEAIADQYMDVMKTRLIGDAAADVFYLDVFEAPFLMRQSVLKPLNEYITPEFDLSDFAPNLLQSFQVDDQIYGLPKDYSTLALFYNKKAFAAAGLDRPPMTWEELLNDSKRLTRDDNGDGKPEQYGLGITPELPRLMYLMKAYGGEAIDGQGRATFATDEALRGLNLVVQQYRNERTAAQPSDVGSASGSDMFGRGKAAMVIEGNWAIPYLKDTFPDTEFGTAELPVVNHHPGTMVFTVAYVMNAKTKHASEAWELIAYLTGKVGMEQWTSTGFALPTRRSVAEALKLDQDRLRSPLVAGVAYGTPWQVGEHSAAILNNFNNQFLSALLGEQPLKQAMARSQDAANQQIQAAE
jgi:multiple sugar transport system substrate-binding protein